MKEIKKAVILARGLGTRLRADAGNVVLDEGQSRMAALGIKTLVPILGDKTLLDFIFESLHAAGFSQFCLIIGDEHQQIRDFCSRLDFDISFAIQKEARGTADAVLAAEAFAADDHFLVVNSDNLYPVDDLIRLREPGHSGFIAYDKQGLIAKSNISEEKINKFATVELDEKGRLMSIVEKPGTTAKDALISMNAWIFSPKIFEACRTIKPSPRGEFELSSAVQLAIDKLDERIIAIRSDKGVLDLSSRDDVASLREKLARLGPSVT